MQNGPISDMNPSGSMKTPLFSSHQIRRLEKPALITLGASLLTLLLSGFEFSLLEARFYDWRSAFSVRPPSDPRIVLVTIDDATTSRLNEFAPLTLNSHARFLEAIRSARPEAIGYLVNMNYVNQAAPEQFLESAGTSFVQSAQDIQTAGTPFLFGTPFDVSGEVIPPYPLSTLPHSIAIIHQDGNTFARDKVNRRALLTLNEHPTFHVRMARELGLLDSNTEIRGEYLAPRTEGTYFLFRHRDPTTYTTVSFVDLMDGTVPAHALDGKIVLVGTLNQENPNDFVSTPISRSGPSPRLAIHASILDSLIQNDGVIEAATWANYLATFVLTALVLT